MFIVFVQNENICLKINKLEEECIMHREMAWNKDRALEVFIRY